MKKGDVFAKRYLLTTQLSTEANTETWKVEDTMNKNAVLVIQFLDSKELNEAKLVEQLSLDHPHLLKTLAADIFEGQAYTVTPFCREGNLRRRMKGGQHFSEHAIAEIMKQLAGGLSYLHENGIAHQNLKPENILALKFGHYVLSDFGVTDISVEKNATKAHLSEDVFSLAAILYELCAGEPPFRGRTLKAEINGLPLTYTRELNDLLASCMSADPEARPTAKELEAAATAFLASERWDPDFRDTRGRKPAKPALPQEPISTKKDWKWLLISLAALALIVIVVIVLDL